MPSSETEYLRAYLSEVEQDLILFRELERKLALRVAEVRSMKNAGLITSDLPEFAGTAAVQGSLAVSISQMGYVLEAVKTQLAAAGPVLQLVQEKDDE